MMYSRICVMTTRWVRRIDLPTYHKTSPHKGAHYGSGALRGFERKKGGRGIGWKVRSNFCHLAKTCASLCATVSKRHGVGSSDSFGFDLLTARCLWISAADLSSGPEPGIHSGSGNEMINNNKPPGEQEKPSKFLLLRPFFFFFLSRQPT